MRGLAHDWFPLALPENVEIGDRSRLHSAMAFLHYRSTRPCGLRIGEDTGVYYGTYFNLGPLGEVEIGDHCTVVSPIFSTNGRIAIGDCAFISFEVVIADSFAAAPHGAGGSRARRRPSRTIEIGDEVWIGMRAIVLEGARLGEGAIVGAGAVVDFEVPAYAVVAGNPARVVGYRRPERPGPGHGAAGARTVERA